MDGSIESEDEFERKTEDFTFKFILIPIFYERQILKRGRGCITLFAFCDFLKRIGISLDDGVAEWKYEFAPQPPNSGGLPILKVPQFWGI
jgi:hypothetical protein